MKWQQSLGTIMRYFRALSEHGVEYLRASRYDNITCAVIIYPLPEGGGLFPEGAVDWYTCQEQAERHARDWRNHGYPVEVVCTEALPEQDYLQRKIMAC